MNELPNWAPYVNEASPGQSYNARFIDPADGARRMAAGKLLHYQLVATRDIQVGEEVLAYYGDDYPRDYPIAQP